MEARVQRPIPSLEAQPITLEQYLELTPEKLELIEGYLIDGPEHSEERTNLLALLLRNVGLQAAVRLAPAGAWEEAIRANG